MTGGSRIPPVPAARLPSRRIRRVAAAILAAATVGAWETPSLAGSPLEGLWRTAEGDGLIEVRPCGADVCGFLVDHSRLKADPAAKDMMNPDPAMRARPMMDMLLLATSAAALGCGAAGASTTRTTARPTWATCACSIRRG